MGRNSDIISRKFFEKVDNTHVCRLCNKVFKGDHVNNLTSHLVKHKHQYNMEQNNDETKCEASLKTLRFSVTMAPEEIKGACVELITTEKLPFAVFDSDAFKVITNQLFEGLGIPAVTARNITELVNEVYENERSWLKEKLKNKLLSLKIGMATSIMGINVQFISKSKIVIKTLGCIELTEHRTAEYLKTKVENVLESFGIEKNQIYTITTNNGRNLIKMVRLFGEEDESESYYTASSDALQEVTVFSVQSLKCAAHSLQLIAKDYLDTIDNDLLKRVRNLAKALRTPDYRSKTRDLNLPQVTMDVQKGWNSTYIMIQRLMAHKSFCLKNVDAALFLNQSEWENMEALLTVLEPVYIATKMLQKEQLFFSDFFKIWLEMKLKIQTNADSSEFLEKLERREKMLLNNPTFLAALYLDPRLQCFIEKEPLKLMCARRHLKEVIVRILRLEKQIENNQCDERPSTSEEALRSSPDVFPSSSDVCDTSQSQTSLLGQYLSSLNVDSEQEEEENYNEDEKKAFYEIDNFFPRQLSIDKPLFEYWEAKKICYPYLYKLAKTVQCVPATQVSVERAFSALKLVSSDLRSNFSPENLQKIMFVKFNK